MHFNKTQKQTLISETVQIKDIMTAEITTGYIDGLIQQICSRPRPVTTWMGDHLLTGKPSQYVNNRLGQLSFR